MKVNMTAQTIVFASQKGGSGKTSSLMSVAIELADRGFKTLIIDTDEQRTACQWARSADGRFPAEVASMAGYAERLQDEIQALKPYYDFILVDTAPSVASPTVHNAILAADGVIIVAQPSALDLWSVLATKRLLEGIQSMKPVETYVLVNRVNRTSSATLCLKELSDYGIPMFGTQLHALTAFQEAAILGTSPVHLGSRGRQAALQVKALADEVVQVFGGHHE